MSAKYKKFSTNKMSHFLLIPEIANSIINIIKYMKSFVIAEVEQERKIENIENNSNEIRREVNDLRHEIMDLKKIIENSENNKNEKLHHGENNNS